MKQMYRKTMGYSKQLAIDVIFAVTMVVFGICLLTFALMMLIETNIVG